MLEDQWQAALSALNPSVKMTGGIHMLKNNESEAFKGKDFYETLGEL